MGNAHQDFHVKCTPVILKNGQIYDIRMADWNGRVERAVGSANVRHRWRIKAYLGMDIRHDKKPVTQRPLVRGLK
jgi:hypothetical protein